MRDITQSSSRICCFSTASAVDALVGEGKGEEVTGKASFCPQSGLDGGGAEVGWGEAVVSGGNGTGEGGGPSRLRLPKDGRGSLPRDMTRRRPVVDDGEGRMRRGRR